MLVAAPIATIHANFRRDPVVAAAPVAGDGGLFIHRPEGRPSGREWKGAPMKRPR